MIQGFAIGFAYPLRGLRWLTRPGLRRYVAIPLLINVLIFGGLTWWGALQVDALSAMIQGWLPGWLEWLSWLLWPLFILAVVLVAFFGFTLVANLIGSPFNGLLAEKVEDQTAPDYERPEQRPLWQEISIAPMIELRKLAYFIPRALGLLVLFLIPGVNLLAPFLWMAFSAWMLALQYVEVPMSNHRIELADQRKLLGRHRGLALGFGAGALVLTLVPVLNFVAMPAAVIGATLLWRERLVGVQRTIAV